MTWSARCVDNDGSAGTTPNRAAGDGPVIGLGSVACNGCVACCRRENILVSASFGDDPHQYEIEREVRPGVFAIAAHANSDCHYLDAKTGCTIYDRRPAMCRSFDCRIEAARPGGERRDLVRRGVVDSAVMRAGRERFLAMSPAARAALMRNYEERARAQTT
ncbi:MAG: YkgJ family cysteine cluster protein [Alphaproteobacteria bacterium]|nr:YkgJ family cysteine cluster protein [Alphaproteobacteria bacterium]